MKNQKTHPTYATLLSYIENTCSRNVSVVVEEHLSAKCPHCLKAVSNMNIMLGYLGDDMVVPPESVIKKALKAFKELKRPVASDYGGVQNLDEDKKALRAFNELKRPVEAAKEPRIRILATPLQLAYAPAIANTRGSGGQLRSRQMLFTADDLDIDLQVKVEKDSATLMGQVLGTERHTAAFVHIHYPETSKYAGEVVDSAATDAFGQFSFRPLPSGVYDLILEVENKEIAIEGLHLGTGR